MEDKLPKLEYTEILALIGDQVVQNAQMRKALHEAHGLIQALRQNQSLYPRTGEDPELDESCGGRSGKPGGDVD